MINHLLAIGFKYLRSCNCDGFKTNVYGKGDYEVKHRIGRDKYKLRQHRVSLTTWIAPDTLQTKINELFPQAVQTQTTAAESI